MSRVYFLRKLRKYVATLPALAFGFVASPAFSTTVTIDANGITAGANSASFIGAAMTSSGGNFTKVTSVGTNASTVIGVSTGSVSNEIDLDAEKISLNFGSTGAHIDEIVLGLLFKKNEWGGAVDEAAQLLTNAGTICDNGSSTSPCILSATGVWRGATAGVTTLSPATEGNGGIFRITNPFGTAVIGSLDFLPFKLTTAGGSADSDFGIVSVRYTTTAIPEPGTLALVGLGTLGLAVTGRRRPRA